AFLLLVGVLPFWEHVQSNRYAKSMLKAVSAGVVGILIAAFYDPIFTSSVNTTCGFRICCYIICNIGNIVKHHLGQL
ncbi:chromate transporter, partial [Staphylococcus sp. KG4-1]|nr:chromate transporter [Staphylococcus sp. KG4-1]